MKGEISKQSGASKHTEHATLMRVKCYPHIDTPKVHTHMNTYSLQTRPE